MPPTEHERNRRIKMKNSHRCIRCGKQDSKTISGKLICEICLSRQQAYNAKKRPYKKQWGNFKFFIRLIKR